MLLLRWQNDRKNDDTISGRKIILGHLSGEDFVSTTDDYRITATSQAGGGQICTIESGTIGVECKLAQ